MFNQLLNEIKEDLRKIKVLKDNKERLKLSYGTDMYISEMIIEERIEVKLQEWHRMASLWLERLERLGLVKIKEDESLDFDTIYQNDTYDLVNKDIKELSTFIQEIEKIAKEQGVSL